MPLTQRLAEYISACFTGLWVQPHEHDDALAEIAQMCRQENWRLCVWDVERGLQIPGQSSGQPADGGSTDPLAAIRSINALASADSSAILTLVNFHLVSCDCCTCLGSDQAGKHHKGRRNTKIALHQRTYRLSKITTPNRPKNQSRNTMLETPITVSDFCHLPYDLCFRAAVRRQPCNKRRPTRNFHRFVQSAEIVQALAQQITTGKQNRSFVVVLSPVVSIPTELEKLFVVVEHDLPGREQLEQIARGIATEEGELPDGDGPVLDGLIEVEKLTIVILSDESLGRGQHALRLAGFSGIPIPWGVKWGGAEQCRFLKNLLLQPVPNGPGLRLSTASTDLLRLGLQLDRDLEEHVRCPPLQVREQLRLPCLWAGFKPADAAGITGDGPELEAYSRRTGKSASRLLEGIRREYFGLVIYPFPWVSHHWRQAVSPPA